MTARDAALGVPRRSAARESLAAVATIMVKELRSRMRGRRAFVVLTVYLAILALITYGVYVIVAPNVRDQAGGGFGGGGFGQANASALIGQSIFTVLSIFQSILVCFIAPAFTAGQISMEREKQTLDLLISTPMRPGAIVIGKLAAALAFVVLMIVAAVPITAIVLTYITMLLLTLGTTMIFICWSVFVHQDQQGFAGPTARAPEQLLYLNPGLAMLDVVGNTEPGGFGGINSMLGQLRGVAAEPSFGEECFGDVCRPVDQFGNPVDNVVDTASGYWWPRISISFVIVGALLTLASMRLVVPAGMRWAFRRSRRLPRSSAPLVATGAAAEGSPVIEELAEPEPGP